MIRTARADGAVLKMPLARYFLFVGAALLALLFVADSFLPKPPAAEVTAAAADHSIIRIQSDRKWPERVVFDTSIPTIGPVQTAAALPIHGPAGVADASAKVRDAFAQLQPSDLKQLQPQLQPSVAKTPVLAPVPAAPHKRKIAKKHAAPPMVLVAQQQRPFGFFANNGW
jgi:hypothetical protein